MYVCLYVCITLHFILLLYYARKINKEKFGLLILIKQYRIISYSIRSACVNARPRYDRSQHTKNRKSWSLIVLQSKQEDHVIGGGN